jgi:GH25 family lysozyme M1 (1,4-beta-N-acetylmuramidase)
VPPYHRLPRRAGKPRTDKSPAGEPGTEFGRRRSGRRTAAMAIAAVAVMGAGLFVTSTVAGATPGQPGVATTAQAAAERAIITHPDRDVMGWSARIDAAAISRGIPGVPTRLPTTKGTVGADAVVSAAASQVSGVDVSHWQGNTDWSYWWKNGRRFAWVKATEGTTYRDSSFNYQYTGSYNVGMIRGSYHFATPNTSSGAAQANFFVAHGGGWSRDGKTLPGVLDIEYNPYGATCYGLSKTAMVNWVRDFTRQYRARTGRDAVIYTSLSWWVACTGNSGAFANTNPLWVPKYASSPGTLPGGWPFYTVWQRSDTPVDQDVFNGSIDRLRALALG